VLFADATPDHAAVDQAVELYYGSLTPSDPKTEKALNKCQLAIGKSAITFLSAKSNALTKCWAAVSKGKGTAPCPVPGDGKAEAAITKAASKRDASIVKACGGPDQTLGTPDDFTADEIGFADDCLNATVPTCASAPVQSLGDLIECVDCITEFKVDCADGAANPAFVEPYPERCNPARTATPTPTLSPTPTPTP